MDSGDKVSAFCAIERFGGEVGTHCENKVVCLPEEEGVSAHFRRGSLI